MNACGSGSWMGICELSLALSIVSGSRTDALVSDFSSNNKSSTGQKTRWQSPAVEWPARRSFAPSSAESDFGRKIPELAGSLKSVDKCSLFLRGCAMELQWRCRTATGHNRIRRLPHSHGGGVSNRRNCRQGNRGATRWSVAAACCLGISRGATQFDC
jgi:hypothetical protein